MVSLAPGLTEFELRPIVNGVLTFAATAFGVTGAPPVVAASAVGAAARAVAAMAPRPASLKGETREREWLNIGISVRFDGGACEVGAVFMLTTVSPPRRGAVRTALRHLATAATDTAVRIGRAQMS